MLDNKEQSTIIKAFDKLEREYGSLFKRYFKSITFDNGSEFLDYTSLEKSNLSNSKRFEIYYVHPYCSSERGSNENIHKFIRKFIPKSKRFNNITDRYIRYIENHIHNYPKKSLNIKQQT